MNIWIVIQARMGSTRLPGKIIKELNGVPLIIRLINQLSKSKYKPNIIVATSLDGRNDVLIDLLNNNKIEYYRGSENDVLSRFISINNEKNPDFIVRATADDPLMSAEIMDYLIEKSIGEKLDYSFMVGLPKGISVEVVSGNAFSRISNAKDLTDYDKEHVTPYIKNHKDLFKVKFFDSFDKYNYPNLEMTIDTPEEFEKMNKLYEKYGDNVSLSEAIEYLK